MHTDGTHGIELAEIGSLLLEMCIGLCCFSMANSHILVVIPYLVSQCGYLTDIFRLIALRYNAEIIACPYAQLMLDPRGS